MENFVPDRRLKITVYKYRFGQFQLDMGFPEEACKKALYYTANSGMEAASNWLMEHMTDWDFANKFQPPGAAAPGTYQPA